MATESILNSTKKVLGISEDDDVFNVDIIMHINSVFATLSQLGIGPIDGFMIEDATPEWDTYLGGDANLNSVKSYMYLRVRLLFDPPSTSFHIDALNKQREELEWRISTYRESTAWVNPNTLIA